MSGAAVAVVRTAIIVIALLSHHGGDVHARALGEKARGGDGDDHARPMALLTNDHGPDNQPRMLDRRPVGEAPAMGPRPPEGGGSAATNTKEGEDENEGVNVNRNDKASAMPETSSTERRLSGECAGSCYGYTCQQWDDW